VPSATRGTSEDAQWAASIASALSIVRVGGWQGNVVASKRSSENDIFLIVSFASNWVSGDFGSTLLILGNADRRFPMAWIGCLEMSSRIDKIAKHFIRRHSHFKIERTRLFALEKPRRSQDWRKRNRH